MGSRGILAIDFGTANTYFCKCPADQSNPKGVDLDGDGHDGLATAILYRDGGRGPLVGRTAFEEYGEATADERRGYTIRAQFKPDIASSEEAHGHSVAFLKAVLENARRLHVDVEPSDRQVIFGVPAEADKAFRDAVVEIAREAGYGAITTREEPLGGLFYHVADKSISANDAMRGVLVVDFGGGTCDFTFTYRGKIERNWGDMHLGGRVFDDLFFQWLMEQNPDVATSLPPEDEFFVMWFHARELKERFSSEMGKRECAGSYSRGAGRYGRLKDATWDAFVERATRYRPSPAFARFLRSIGGKSSLLATEEPTDLIGWFKRSLGDGLASSAVEPREIATVILTGGSSQWPFVPEILQQVLRMDRSRFRRSDRPFAAISQGLAIEPALQNQLKSTRQNLHHDRDRFMRENVASLVDEHVRNAANEIADTITSELFDERIKPALREFREVGGKIADLKATIANLAAHFEPRVNEIVVRATDRISVGLPELVIDQLRVWFESHGLRIDRDALRVANDPIAATRLSAEIAPDVLRDFNRLVAGISAGIVSIVSASICGGSGTAIIAGGPVGLFIGLVIGAVAAYYLTAYGLEKARSMAESVDLRQFGLRQILKFAMRDATIDSARRDLRKRTCDQVSGELKKLQAVVNEQLEGVVRKEIEAVSELYLLL